MSSDRIANSCRSFWLARRCLSYRKVQYTAAAYPEFADQQDQPNCATATTVPYDESCTQKTVKWASRVVLGSSREHVTTHVG